MEENMNVQQTVNTTTQGSITLEGKTYLPLAVQEVTSANVGKQLEGLCAVESYNIGETAKGKPYISGVLRTILGKVTFKIWDMPFVDIFKNNDMRKSIICVLGTIKEYNGSLELHIVKIWGIPSDIVLDLNLFFPAVNCDSLFTQFCNTINTEMSLPYAQVLMSIFSTETSALETFKYAYAASGHHDALSGGLLNHTYKMLQIMVLVISQHPELQPYKDLLLLCCVLHDIGKIKEMVKGVYQPNAFNTHRILGLEFIFAQKALIVQQLGEDVYHRIVSVIVGHHGDFDCEPPTTIYAYIVHLVDMLDSQCTGISETLRDNSAKTSSTGEKFIKINDFKLTI